MAIGENIETLLRRAKGTRFGPMSPLGREIIELDATTRRRHADPGTVARFPVEEADDGIDNYHPEATTLEVEGVLTDTPLRFGAGFSAGPRRAVELYQRIIGWRTRAEPMWVSTPNRDYLEMILESISVSEDPDSGNAVWLALTFVSGRILRSATLPSQFDLAAKIAGAGGDLDAGTQQLQDPSGYTGPTVVGG